ncbi:MAG: hypothetical protein R2684_05830 [Pyrinomonadaceae bacterium]
MNVYQKVLVKLYEVTGGRESKTVYLRDIVKDLGFLPSYKDILKQMSADGWLTEGRREGEVNITPWGIREAKKLGEGFTDNSRDVARGTEKLRSETRELLVFVDEFAGSPESDALKRIEAKLKAVEGAAADLKKFF